MIVLAMTALLANLIPAIRLEPCNEFLNLCWHRALIVLRAPRACLMTGMLSVRPTLGLPEGTLAIRSKMPGLFARDGDLIGALVERLNLRPDAQLAVSLTQPRTFAAPPGQVS